MENKVMTFADLMADVLEEASISEIMKKPSNMLTQDEKNRLAKFKFNLANRQSRTRPPYSKGEDAWQKHNDKYENAQKKVGDKVKKAGQGGVVTSHDGYYR